MYLMIGNEPYKKMLGDGKVGETTNEGWWNKI